MRLRLVVAFLFGVTLGAGGHGVYVRRYAHVTAWGQVYSLDLDTERPYMVPSALVYVFRCNYRDHDDFLSHLGSKTVDAMKQFLARAMAARQAKLDAKSTAAALLLPCQAVGEALRQANDSERVGETFTDSGGEFRFRLMPGRYLFVVPGAPAVWATVLDVRGDTKVTLGPPLCNPFGDPFSAASSLAGK